MPVYRKDRKSFSVFDVDEVVRVLEVGPFQIGEDRMRFRLDVLRRRRLQESLCFVRV